MRPNIGRIPEEIWGAKRQALSKPVIITRNGRDRFVLMSAEAFQRMSRYAPRARRIEALTDEELAMISEARVSAEHDHLNTLLDD